MTIHVAISTLSVERKPDAFTYAILHQSYQNVEIECGLDLVDAVVEGRAYGAWTKREEEGSNKSEFISSSIISVDVEGGEDADYKQIAENPFFQMHGLAVYTTMSHTDEEPRCRAIFVLEQPIKKAEDYSLLAKAVAQEFRLPDLIDKGSWQPLRRFLGNPNAKVIVVNRTIQLDIAKGMTDAIKIAQKKREPVNSSGSYTSGSYGAAPDFLLDKLNYLATLGEDSGNRNNTLNRVAFLFGKYAVGPGRMSTNLAEDMLRVAAERCGLKRVEAERTIRSGLSRGMEISTLRPAYHDR